MVLFSCVVLVDRRGWVLLQERDEHARIAPERWGFAGGHLEPGEDHLTAAVRELEEETRLRIPPDDLTRVGELEIDHPETRTTGRIAMYAAATDLTDDDVECHEGRQIVFVDPATVTALPLSDSARLTLLPFLDSELYRRLADPTAPKAHAARVDA